MSKGGLLAGIKSSLGFGDDKWVDMGGGRMAIRFFKLDYNIDPGAGTDVNADSLGSGLLEHNRAHLQWLDAVLDRHPGLGLQPRKDRRAGGERVHD